MQIGSCFARRRIAWRLHVGRACRLLEEATVDIIGVTGASAGAMNGAVLVDGLVRGGKQARAKLRQYWEAVGAMSGFGSFFSGMSGQEAATTPLETIPAYADLELKNRNLSPYDLFAVNYNPMRPVVTELMAAVATLGA